MCVSPGPPQSVWEYNDNNYGNEDQGDRLFLKMTRAIAELAHSNCNACQPQPLPDPPTQARVRKPEQFDGSDTHKLCTFFVQCELNFQDRPQAFAMGTAKVVFAMSYLTGAALEWFEPDLLRGPHACHPPWMDDYAEFTFELERNFGPHNPIGDAEHQLASLSMKDGQCINRYIIEFNRFMSQVCGYGKGAL